MCPLHLSPLGPCLVSSYYVCCLSLCEFMSVDLIDLKVLIFLVSSITSVSYTLSISFLLFLISYTLSTELSEPSVEEFYGNIQFWPERSKVAHSL